MSNPAVMCLKISIRISANIIIIIIREEYNISSVIIECFYKFISGFLHVY